jgi:hypothetical protein
MQKKNSFSIALLLALALCTAGGDKAPAASPRVSVYDVHKYGATGNGITLDSPAINAAIAECSKNGGGTVRLTPGTYRCGTIHLLDNVVFQLESGAVVLGSANLSDYCHLKQASEGRDTALIVAENVHNIAIVGKGTIDGNGRAFVDPTGPHWQPSFDVGLVRQGQAWAQRMIQSREGPVNMLSRPGILVVALHVDGLKLHDFHVVDSPNWAIKIGGSRNIEVSRLDVRNDLLIPNNDALEVSTSRDATIQDCYLEAGDDALVVGGPCLDGWCKDETQHIRVRNVTLISRSAAIRVGPQAKGARDLSFSHVTIKDSNRGILIQARSDETLENIFFDHVTVETRLIDGPWWGAGEPIAINVAHWDYASWPKTSKLGSIRHLRFSDIIANSQAPIVIHSMEPGHIQDLSFQNLSLTLAAGPLTPLLGGNLDLQPTSPPLEFNIRRQDLPAILVHNAENLSFAKLRVNWQGSLPDFYTNALSADGFKDLSINDFRGRAAQASLPAIQLQNGTGVAIKNALATQGKLLDKTNVQDLHN